MIDQAKLKAAIDDWNDTAENGTMPPDRRATLRLVVTAARAYNSLASQTQTPTT